MRNKLEAVLATMERPVVAVSGGVDSVTLAAITLLTCRDATVIHAASPAVPSDATARVRSLAERLGWPLTVLDAGEFRDPNYRANPVNRCFHCKSNLYSAIRLKTPRQILSGANLDDLGEYRPGLQAASEHAVRHPYIEAGFDKSAVRALARLLGLAEVTDLPASPCLSSRVETGIRIEPSMLGFIHRVERSIAAAIEPRTVRCRIRAQAVVVELDPDALEGLDPTQKRRLSQAIVADPDYPKGAPLQFSHYKNGSAFLITRMAT